MDALTLYKDLLNEIATDEAALLKKKDVAEFLRSRIRMDGGDTVQRSSSSAHTAGAGRVYPLKDAEALGAAPRTLTQAVIEAIDSLGGAEFVVGDVYDVLIKRDESLPDQPKSKIATVLARLTDRGELVLTFKGGGNVPNRYRSTKFVQKNDEEGAAEMTDLA